jgi:class 3 adenylate cyclase
MRTDPSATAGTAPLPPGVERVTLGVAFFDLSRIPEWVSSDDDARVAAFFEEVYAAAQDALEPAGGRIVKLMGDAGLVAFPPNAMERVVPALHALASAVRRRAQKAGFDTFLNASVHVGPVYAGEFGPPDNKRFDVIGKTVNVAARLGRRGITLSSQAFRCLPTECRAACEKIRTPTNYRFRGLTPTPPRTER